MEKQITIESADDESHPEHTHGTEHTAHPELEHEQKQTEEGSGDDHAVDQCEGGQQGGGHTPGARAAVSPQVSSAASLGLLDAVLYSPQISELEQHVKTSSQQAAAASKRAAKDLARVQKKMRAEVNSERRKLSGGESRKKSSCKRRSSPRGPILPAAGQMRAEVEQLRSQARTWTTEKEAFRAEVEGLEKNLKRLSSALQASENKMKTVVQQKAELNRQLKLQQKALREQERKAVPGEVSAADAPIDGTVYLRLQAQQRKLADLERECDEARAKQTELRVDAEIALASLQAEEERHAATTEDLAEVQATLASTSERLADVERVATEQASESLKMLELERRAKCDLTEEVKGLRKRLQDSNEDLLRCKKALEAAEAREKASQSEHAGRAAAHGQLQSQLEEAKRNERQTLDQLREMTAKLGAERKLSQSLAQHNAACTICSGWNRFKARQALAECRRAFSDTLRQCIERGRAQTESRVVELESKLEEMALQLDQHSADIEDKTNAIRELTDQTAAAQQAASDTASGAKERERELTQLCQQLESDLRTARATSEAEATLRIDSGTRDQTDIRELKTKLQALGEAKDQLQAQLAGAEALAAGQRDVATEVRKLLDTHKRQSDEQMAELRQTISELEEELVATADERDALHGRLSDTSEKEAVSRTIAQLKQQLLASKAEVHHLRQTSIDKDTKIAQLRTQASAHATVAMTLAAPSPGPTEPAAGTPCRVSDQPQQNRDWADVLTATANTAGPTTGGGRKSNGRMGESAHVERLRRARRNTMDRDSFSRGAPIAFLNAKKRVEEQAAAEETAQLAVELAPESTVAVHVTTDSSVMQQLARPPASALNAATTNHCCQQTTEVSRPQHQPLMQEQAHRGCTAGNGRSAGPTKKEQSIKTVGARASSPAVSKRGRSTPRPSRPRSGSHSRPKKQAGGDGLYERLSSPGRSSLSNRRRSEAKTISYVV